MRWLGCSPLYRNATGNRRCRNESLLGHHCSVSRDERSKLAPTQLSRAPRDGNRGFSRGLRVNNATKAALETPREEDEDGVVNALVIVGTMEGPVEGYLWRGQLQRIYIFHLLDTICIMP